MHKYLFLFLLTTSYFANSQSKILLDFDQTIYILGDDLYFTAHVFPLQNTSKQPQILRVELVTISGNQVVHQQKLTITNHQAHGAIPLNLKWEEGYYALKVYTLFQPGPTIGAATVAYVPIYDSFKEREGKPIALETENLSDGTLKLSKQQYKRQEEISFSLMDTDFFIPPSITASNTEITQLPEIQQKQQSFSVTLDQFPETIDMEYGSLNEPGTILGLGVHHLGTNDLQWITPNQSGIFTFRSDTTTTQKYQVLAIVNEATVITSRYAVLNPYTISNAIPIDKLQKPLPINQTIAAYLRKSALQKKYKTLFKRGLSKKSSIVKKESKLIPDHTYLISNYASMTSLEEFLREVVSFVRIKKKKEDLEISMFNEEKIFTEFNPLFLVDGKIVYNQNEVFSIPIEELSHIDIFRKTATKSKQFGLLGKHGVIAIYRKKTAQVADEEHQIFTQPISQSLLYAPLKKKGKLPDFRHTIYWNPSFKNGSNKVSFQHSDDIGDFTIRVSGINRDGERIERYGYYQVR